jgi:hypothetical protein
MPAAVAPARIASHRPTGAVVARRIAWLLFASLFASFLVATATACPNHEGEATHPPPEVYGETTDFSGEWRGEVGDITGMLKIEKMDANRYYANFRGADRPVRYILSLDQIPGEVAGDGSAPSNLCVFTWQDGRGGRGEGWLLINREHSALTGTFGRGEGTTGMGVWTFIKEGGADPDAEDSDAEEAQSEEDGDAE